MSRARLPLFVLTLAGLLLAGARAAGPLQAQEEKKFKPVEIDGKLEDTDPLDKKKGHPCKLHRLDLVKGQSYVIDLVSKDFDPYLRLEDPDGKTVAEGDDSGGETNARITYTATVSGNYQVSATSFQGGGGAYSLKIRQVEPSKFQLGKALEVGEDGLKIDSKLEADDPASPVKPMNPCKVYSVKLKKDHSYIIELNSADFDAYLNVLDGQLKSLAEDDDSGGELNAKLTFRPESEGTYHIVASSLDRATGPFTLRVRPGKDETKDSD